MRYVLAMIAALWATSALAEVTPRPGWSVTPTGKAYDQLIADLKAAVKAQKFGVVTQAGPTKAAKSRGITIPGNRVIGVFNNDFAVRVLALSTPAMIEAPIRFYVTENPDGTATLSYKTPTHVFAPYLDEAGPELAQIALDLDTAFAQIATNATSAP
jgi:uncharacterized protein (DUF302 family)